MLEIRIAGVVSATASSVVRCIVFRWHAQSNLDTLVVDSILDASFTGDATAPLAPFVHDNHTGNKKKIQVLYDCSFDLYGGSEGNFHRTIKISKGLKRPIQYYAGSTINQSSGLYMLLISDNVLASAPTLRAVSRLHFVE